MPTTTLEKKLYDGGVYNAWQYVVNTSKTIQTAAYCKNVIQAIIATMETEHTKWETNLFAQLQSQDGSVRKISISSDDLPKHELSIAGVEVPSSFLLDKLTKDFFQYCRNAFDCISQIGNAACLAFREKKVEKVDFPFMLQTFQQQMYLQAFPDIAAWFEKISKSDEYVYLDAFCNRTKHICDVYLRVSLAFMGGENRADINPFYRKDVQHDKESIYTYLSTIYDFVEISFKEFLALIELELPNRTYVENRYHQLYAYQQRMKDNEESDFSVVYIKENVDVHQMPDEIEILLLSEAADGDIWSKNCPIDTIYIQSATNENDYVGKYVASELCGDDTLLRYRRYQKQIADPVQPPMRLEILREWQKNKIFYKNNPFIEITAVSDIDEFLARVQLPF